MIPRAYSNPGRWVWPVAAAGSAVLLGAGIGRSFVGLLLVVSLGVLATGLALLVSPQARALFLVGGALVLFGGSSVLGTPGELSFGRTGYLAGSMLIIAGAAIRLGSLRRTEAYSVIRPVMNSSLLFGGYVVVLAVAGVSGGTSPIAALRDAASFLLFAALPLLALDARTGTSPALLKWTLVAAGCVGTVAYVTTWVTARELADLGIGNFALSGELPGALLSLIAAGAFLGKRRVLWASGLGLVFGALLLTGNRAQLVVLASPAAMVLLAGKGRARKGGMFVLAALLAGISGFLFFDKATEALKVDTAVLSSRYESLLDPSHLATDQSYLSRRSQTRVAAGVFWSHEVFGVGPGYVFEWSPPSGDTFIASFQLDSPMMVPAKFGVVGLAVLLLMVLLYASLVRRLLAQVDIYRLALLGYLVFGFVTALIQGVLLDSKGFAIGLLLLMALSLPDPSVQPKAEEGAGYLPANAP